MRVASVAMALSDASEGFTMESAPFKLTQEWIDVLGGEQSKKFDDFRKRMAKGFSALQENAEKIIILVEMMLNGQSDLPCFIGDREPGLRRVMDPDPELSSELWLLTRERREDPGSCRVPWRLARQQALL